MTDAQRVDDLLHRGAISDQQLRDELLAAALSGLRYYAVSGELRRPVDYRLAFRELGLAIGLQSIEPMWQIVNDDSSHSSTSPELRAQLQALREYVPLRNDIESVWRNPEHHRSTAWSEHRDINEVMLATCLVPEGFLVTSALNP